MRLFAWVLVILVAGCGDDVSQPVAKVRELVVLTRPGELTYSLSAANEASGFEHDLARQLARDLGIHSRFVLAANDEEIRRRLARGEAHMAAAWQVAPGDPELRAGIPYFRSRNLLVTHEAHLPVTSPGDLAGRTVGVVAGSRQEAALKELQETPVEVVIDARAGQTEVDLLEAVANFRLEAALVNNAEFAIGSNYYPELQHSLVIGPERSIVWLFAPGVDEALIARANDFLARAQSNGEMERLRDRYFGHIDRLSPLQASRFIERMATVLPRYRALFEEAQRVTGIDWRVLAALAYQESQWDPLATSPTGVRGMMMLTADTADALGVGNRLDAAQCIRAGARYLADLRDALPISVGEPDRLWLAIAAYNLGMGHMNAARQIARTQNTDPDSWYAMKRVLPLLAKERYYSRLKSGKGRGGEAVIMTENVRLYADILARHVRP